jgi:hypothetical protein
MKPRPLVHVRLLPLILVQVCSLVALTPNTGLAFHGATFAAWHNTWHGPNALETPLRQYFIPRLPGHCDRAAYAENFEYVDSNGDVDPVQDRVDYPAPCSMDNRVAVGTACLTVRSDRLGQIPNDLESATTMAVGATGR